MAIEQSQDMVVFVYGSLMSGQNNHHLLSKACFLGKSISRPLYTLFDAGPWPALVTGGTTAIHGELYLISPELCISLDRFEGHPTLFRRSTILLQEAREADAWFLHATGDPSWPTLRSGSWTAQNLPHRKPD